MCFRLHYVRVTNLLTLNLGHGGCVRGRFGKGNAAASAASVDERQGAGVAGRVDAPRAAGRAREPRLPASGLSSRVFRFPGVRTSSLHCSANSGRSTRGLGRYSSARLSANTGPTAALPPTDACGQLRSVKMSAVTQL